MDTTLSAPDTLFSIERAAAALGISAFTLRLRIRRGEITPHRILNGRQPVFSQADLDKLRDTDA
jgi:DNA-binding transcriptional MerR regulator